MRTLRRVCTRLAGSFSAPQLIVNATCLSAHADNVLRTCVVFDRVCHADPTLFYRGTCFSVFAREAELV